MVADIVKNVASLQKKALSEPFNRLLAPVDTRWSSVQIMLQRFLPLRKFVNEVFEEEGLQELCFSDREVEVLEAMEEVLEPFAEVTRQCEGEKYVTIASIPKWVGLLSPVSLVWELTHDRFLP
jgi:hypothetical protein